MVKKQSRERSIALSIAVSSHGCSRIGCNFLQGDSFACNAWCTTVFQMRPSASGTFKRCLVNGSSHSQTRALSSSIARNAESTKSVSKPQTKGIPLALDLGGISLINNRASYCYYSHKRLYTDEISFIKRVHLLRAKWRNE